MRDLAILLAATFSAVSLRWWLPRYMPDLLLAVVGIIDRTEPVPVGRRSVAAELTQADVGWGQVTWPAVKAKWGLAL